MNRFRSCGAPMMAALMLVASAALAQGPKSVPYRWKSVQMVGAGFVDGVIFHPKAKDVRYARTDIGGAYRWDARARRWAPMMDWVPYADLNLMGVESIAVDPIDARKVFLACGTYTNAATPDGAILRSRDGGRTFAVSRVPIKFGGNENGRGNGERLSVDPNDPRILFLGTRNAGLWRSDDGAVTWRRIDSFPWTAPPRSAGIIATLVDPSSGRRGIPSRVIYAAVSDLTGPTLFRSDDEGAAWAAVPGAPTGLVPTRMTRAEDGAIWISYGSSPGPSRMTNGAVWKLQNGAWTDVTPEKPTSERRFGYAAVAVQADHPEVAIASSFGRPGGEQIFRTLDGGKTWRPIIGGKETYDASGAPYQARTGIHWLFDIEIDPRNPDHATFTTGYGGHETYNLTDADKGKPVRWRALAPGIEESVALSLLSPTKGVPLVLGIGDYGGGAFRDIDHPLPGGSYLNPAFGNTESVAAGDLAPEIIVRVGSPTNFDVRVGIGYSTDGGATWKPTSVPVEGARGGHLAVAADGSAWLWTLRGGTFLTRDQGKTWARCEGLTPAARVIADRVNPARFYALDLFGGKLYRSTDGGATFVGETFVLPGGLPARGGDRGDNRGGQDQLYATPGRTGDLWIAAADGLYHAPEGRTWTRMPGVQVLHAFGFGKAAPEQTTPALYMVGTVEGQRGIFRSDDGAISWVRINDDAHQWGLVLQITGDPKQYGRVYVGTHGRGAFYGDPR
jgi:photosystem II stability/assembly factor-like uncharacterized protein